MSVLIHNLDHFFIFNSLQVVYGCLEVLFVDMVQNDHFKIVLLFCKFNNVVDSAVGLHNAVD